MQSSCEGGICGGYEIEARAKYAEQGGRAAFFIRIEDIEQGLENAFEVGSTEAFEYWLDSRNEARFFLDSVDEPQLENPRMFEKAIRHFAARIKKAHQRAHIFISSRPYAWRARTDGDLLERLLPYKKPKSEPTEDAENVAEESVNNESGAPESALRVYLLDPLYEDDIRIFAEHRNAPKVDRLVKNCPASRWSLHKRRVLMVAVAKSRK